MSLKTRIKTVAVTGTTGAASSLALVSMAGAQCDSGAGGVNAGIECAKPTGAQENLFGDGSIFNTVVNTLLFVVGAISVIMLIIGGVRYVVSAGDQNAVTGAKNTILYAIVGIVIAFLAYAAVNFVLGSLDTSS